MTADLSPTGDLHVTAIFLWGDVALSLLRRSYVLTWPSTLLHPKTLGSTIYRRLFARARCDADSYGDAFFTVSFWRFWPQQIEGQMRFFDLLASNMERANLPGWCWAEIQQFALVGSSSSLHSEACNALGASDGIIHGRISLEAICFRAITYYQNIQGDHLAHFSSKTAPGRAHREGVTPCEVFEQSTIGHKHGVWPHSLQASLRKGQ